MFSYACWQIGSGRDSLLEVQRGAPKLQQRYAEVLARERAAAWSREADALDAERVKLNNEFNIKYPQYAAELESLFTRMALHDRKVYDLNWDAPNNVHRRLYGCEESVRIRNQTSTSSSIASRLVSTIRGTRSVYSFPRLENTRTQSH